MSVSRYFESGVLRFLAAVVHSKTSLHWTVFLLFCGVYIGGNIPSNFSH